MAPRGGAWPTPDQELLVDAATGPAEQAPSRWRRWLERNHLDDVDTASHNLLPLLFRNLMAAGEDVPQLGRLRGLHRYWWVRNEQQLQRVAGAAEILDEAGIPAVLVKGTAIVVAGYRAPGTRPMGDLDVVVRPGDEEPAVGVLVAHGWEPLEEWSGRARRYAHSIALRGPQDEELDLHWHILQDELDPEVDRRVWSRVRRQELRGARIGLLDPAHHLVVIVNHGLAWNEVAPVRWVPDALALLESEASIDWSEVVDLSVDARIAHRIGLGLRYLRERFDAPVPGSTIAELEAVQVAWWQRIEHAAKMAPWHTWWATPVMKSMIHLRSARWRGTSRMLRTFPEMLSYVLGTSTSAALPEALVDWVRRRYAMRRRRS